jgi:hypothetical protein
MTTNYFPLTNLPLLSDRFIDEALTIDYSLPGNITNIQIENTNRIGVAQSSFIESDFFKDLNEKFGANEAVYLRFAPGAYYDWHADGHRKCCINFTIEDYTNSLTLFRTRISDLDYTLEKVNYVSKQATVLNNSVEHCVINLSESNRYVLSIGFPLTVDYPTLKEYLSNLSITSY